MCRVIGRIIGQHDIAHGGDLIGVVVAKAIGKPARQGDVDARGRATRRRGAGALLDDLLLLLAPVMWGVENATD